MKVSGVTCSEHSVLRESFIHISWLRIGNSSLMQKQTTGRETPGQRLQVPGVFIYRRGSVTGPGGVMSSPPPQEKDHDK